MAQRRTTPLSFPVIDEHTCTPNTRIASLGNVPLFAGLTPDELTQVNRHCHARSISPGDAIYHEGEPADHLYVVAHGAIKTTRLTVDGRETLFDLLGPGDFFGALPALGQESLNDNAWALSAGCLLALDSREYGEIMAEFPSVAVATLTGVSRRLSSTQYAMHMLAGAPLAQRLAAAILVLADKVGVPWDGAVLLQVPLSREDLAAMTGTTPESVSRVVSRWQKDGLIESGRRWIAVRNAPALEEIRDAG